MMDTLQTLIYSQKLFNLVINAKTINHVHLKLQNLLIVHERLKYFLLFRGIQQTECNTVMSIDAVAGRIL